MKKKYRIQFLDVVTVAAAVVLLCVELLKPRFSEDETVNRLITVIVSRLVGCLVFIPLAVKMKYGIWRLTADKPLFALLCSLPALLVVINNFPFIGLLSGSIAVTKPARVIILFAAESLSIGLFEEFAFRGVLYPVILENRRNSTKNIFWATVISSALFGAVHILNLLEGAGAGGVFLQIGYSFLIGGMCAIVLLKTHSIWICVLLHAVFDFGGFFVGTVAEGIIWDPVTVTITAVLGVLTLAHMVFVLFRVTPADTDWIYSDVTVRKTCNEDLPVLREIYARARRQMAEDGNPHQWGDRCHPHDDVLLKDVVDGTGYAIVKDGRVHGTFAFIRGEDPTYTVIENGAWPNDLPYGTIHRIASDGEVKGIFDIALSFCEKSCNEIRIDTHDANKRMQHIVEKNGFVRCGIIYTDDGTPRIAYQKHVR